MANRNWANSRVYTGHIEPVLIDCNFVVDSTNGNGLGIRSLKGPYVQNIFMNTSATPGAGNSGTANPAIPVINPNPAAGTIVIQLQDNYNRSYFGGFSIVSPLSGTPVLVTAPLTPGIAYTIVLLGTTTVANWHALGVPAGVAPAVGVSFIASAATGVGTGAVEITAALGSGVASIETVGDLNLSMSPDPSAAQGFGAQIILQCRDYAGAIVAPAAGSVIALSLMLSNSSVLIQGE